jgi:hypothetical protein
MGIKNSMERGPGGRKVLPTNKMEVREEEEREHEVEGRQGVIYYFPEA